MKHSIILLIAFLFLENNYVMGQRFELYKANKDITTEQYDVYILIDSLKRYSIFGLYNYGEPTIDYFKDDDELPQKPFLLSYGNFTDENGRIYFDDIFIGIHHVFYKTDGYLICEKSFDFLINNKVKKVFKPINMSEVIFDHLLEYEFIEVEDIKNEYFNAKNNYQYSVETTMEHTNILQDAVYDNSHLLFNIEIFGDSYSYNVGPLKLLSGKCYYVGNELIFTNNLCLNCVSSNIVNSSIFMFSLPGIMPGQKLNIKKHE